MVPAALLRASASHVHINTPEEDITLSRPGRLLRSGSSATGCDHRKPWPSPTRTSCCPAARPWHGAETIENIVRGRPQGHARGRAAARDLLRGDRKSFRADYRGDMTDWTTDELRTYRRPAAPARGVSRPAAEVVRAALHRRRERDRRDARACQRRGAANSAQWRWERLASVPELVVPFRRAIYAQVARRSSRGLQQIRSAAARSQMSHSVAGHAATARRHAVDRGLRVRLKLMRPQIELVAQRAFRRP